MQLSALSVWLGFVLFFWVKKKNSTKEEKKSLINSEPVLTLHCIINSAMMSCDVIVLQLTVIKLRKTDYQYHESLSIKAMHVEGCEGRVPVMLKDV